MKKILSVILILTFGFTANAQSVAKNFSTATPVKINAWGSRSVSFITGFWEMAIPQLKKKLSKQLVDSIYNYSSQMYQPQEFTRSLEHEDAKPDKNDLKMYLVATFDNNFNGTFHGVEYVIWVPKAENKDWTPKEYPLENDFFLIFPKEAITIVN